MDAHETDRTTASAGAPLALAGAAAHPTASLAAGGADACLTAPLPANFPSPSAARATTAASAHAAGLVPSGFGLPGYPTCAGALTGLPSPTRLPRLPPPGFSTTRPIVVDAAWASPPPSTDSTLASTIAAIQAALAASQEREHTVSRTLEQERALATTLTAQMAIAQRLVIGPPPVDQETPHPP